MYEIKKELKEYRKLQIQLPAWFPGFSLLAVIAFISNELGKNFPLIGGVVIAIALGMLIRNGLAVRPVYEEGVHFTTKRVLKVAIVFLGAGLSISEVLAFGSQSLIIIVSVVVIGILSAILIGKILKIDDTLAMLIGVGTGICGATAITAVKGLLDSKETQTAYAISTIFFFNLIATLLYPFIGNLFQMSETMFGIWTGTAVHDTSSVIAVGYMYGNEAGEVATTVKLVRTLFLIPVMLCVGFWISKKHAHFNHSSNSEENLFEKMKSVFPWFILGFIGMSLVNSMGWIAPYIQSGLIFTAKFLVLMVMVGVGIQVEWKKIVRLGFKPLLTGLCASLVVALVSLGLILAVGLG